MTGDLIQCSGCPEMAAGVADGALPDGWDALAINNPDAPGVGLYFYCPECVGHGHLERDVADAEAAGPSSRFAPRARMTARRVLTLYRPAAREVLVAVDGGMFVIAEDEAEALAAALCGALVVRDHARLMAAKAGE